MVWVYLGAEATFLVPLLAAYGVAVASDVLVCKMIHKLLQVTETV